MMIKWRINRDGGGIQMETSSLQLELETGAVGQKAGPPDLFDLLNREVVVKNGGVMFGNRDHHPSTSYRDGWVHHFGNRK